MKGFFQSKKVLVTGGTGFIGSHVVEKLVDLGAHVTVLDRLRDGQIKHVPHLKDKIKIIQTTFYIKF